MRKQCIKRGMSVLSAFIIGFTTVAGLMGSGITSKAATNISNPRVADDGTVTWDKVTFGSYYQDMNDIVKEPIKWRILSVNEDGTDAFLLADKGLDCKPYNSVGVSSSNGLSTDYSCTWKDSTLRTWLNDETDTNSFIYKAFNSTERGAIKTTQVSGDVTDTGDVEDKIYLLGVTELRNEEYGFNQQLKENSGIVNSSTSWAAKGTDYSCINGAYRSENGNCIWWLRCSYTSGTISCVSSDEGYLSSSYPRELNDTYAVRPVLHVDLKNNNFIKYAGTVSSDGSFNDELGETIPAYSGLVPAWDEDNKVATWNCVYFGNYKQNATFQKKAIEWRVLSVNGNDAFLIADKALDSKPYNNENGVVKETTTGQTYTDYSCPWADSSIRKWLNDKTNNQSFINQAFSQTEQNVIITTAVSNDGKNLYGSELNNGGGITSDQIYLLSVEEAMKYEYGFEETSTYPFDYGNIIGNTRNTKPTDYAYINSTHESGTGIDCIFDVGCDWWLRSTTEETYGRRTYVVNWIDNWESNIEQSSFSYSHHGYHVFVHCVRPVLHVNYKAALEQGLMAVSSGKATALNATQKKVSSINQRISAIETPIIVDFGDDEAVIDMGESLSAIKDDYDSLPDSAKERVTNYDDFLAAKAEYEASKKQYREDTANAAKVDELISAIGEVTLESKSKITEARTAYDALTSGARNKVTKYDVLTAAETKLAELEAKKDSPATTEAPKTDATTEAPATTEETKTEVTDAQMKKTTPAVATVKEEKTKKGKVSITIKWKTVNGANGYKVYRSTRKNKGYKCVKTIRKAATKSWKDTGVKTGKTYYYKMRAYKKSGKKTIYSKYSSTKKIRVK